MQEKSHTVIRMQIHLLGEKSVLFEPGHESEAIEKIKNSMLEAWFDLNKENPEARQFKYSEMGEKYVWNKNNERKWKK